MKKTISSLVMALGLSTSALGAYIEPATVNPTVVAKIIEQSELVHCKDNICYYADRPEVILQKEGTLPDGYLIIFPYGEFNESDIESSKDFVIEFYQDYFSKLYMETENE